MKRYLELFLLMITGLFVSCGPDGYYGPQSPDEWGGHMMHYGYGYGHGGIIMSIIFLLAIGLLIYLVVQVQKSKGQPPPHNESHLDILRRRYAKGEITKEEYETMKKILKNRF
jgi:putative membrane protein